MKLTPMKAIRKKCLDCSCGQVTEVRHCTVKTCPLYLYRSGHRPKGEEVSIEDDLSVKTPPTKGVNGKEESPHQPK